MKILFSNNILREDLHLGDKWWHRLFSTLFFVSFAITLIVTILNLFDSSHFPKYEKMVKLSERLTDNYQLISKLVNPGEKIAYTESDLYGLYNRNGGWLVDQEYYCSKNIANHVESISGKTGVNYYKGNLDLISMNDFKNYLSENNAICIEVLKSDNAQRYGDVKKVLSWGLEADNMLIWQKSTAKSILSFIYLISTRILTFVIILVFYYKIFLYIVFGSKKAKV